MSSHGHTVREKVRRVRTLGPNGILVNKKKFASPGFRENPHDSDVRSKSLYGPPHIFGCTFAANFDLQPGD